MGIEGQAAQARIGLLRQRREQRAGLGGEAVGGRPLAEVRGDRIGIGAGDRVLPGQCFDLRARRIRAPGVAQGLGGQRQQRQAQGQRGQPGQAPQPPRKRRRSRREFELEQVQRHPRGGGGQARGGLGLGQQHERARTQHRPGQGRLGAEGQLRATHDPGLVTVEDFDAGFGRFGHHQAVGHQRIGHHAQRGAGVEPGAHALTVHHCHRPRGTGRALAHRHVHGFGAGGHLFLQHAPGRGQHLQRGAIGQLQPGHAQILAGHDHDRARPGGGIGRGRRGRIGGQAAAAGHMAGRVQAQFLRARPRIGGQEDQAGAHSSKVHRRATTRSRLLGSRARVELITTCTPDSSTSLRRSK